MAVELSDPCTPELQTWGFLGPALVVGSDRHLAFLLP